jgi:hypothetical protein
LPPLRLLPLVLPAAQLLPPSANSVLRSIEVGPSVTLVLAAPTAITQMWLL